MKLWWCFVISWIFFRIFYYGSGRHTLKRIFFLFSPFRCLSQPILSWKEAMMEFCNFLNFFAIFLEFSIPSRVGTHRNYFFFLTFSAFHNLFRLEKKLRWCFQIFWIFLLFFWYFLLRVGKGHIGKIFFLFSLFLGLSHPIFAWKEALMVFSKFLNIFLYFYIIFYSRSGRNPSERFFFFFFYFLSFSAFPYLFWLQKKLWWCFLNFWILLLLFWNFLLRVG